VESRIFGKSAGVLVVFRMAEDVGDGRGFGCAMEFGSDSFPRNEEVSVTGPGESRSRGFFNDVSHKGCANSECDILLPDMMGPRDMIAWFCGRYAAIDIGNDISKRVEKLSKLASIFTSCAIVGISRSHSRKRFLISSSGRKVSLKRIAKASLGAFRLADGINVISVLEGAVQRDPSVFEQDDTESPFLGGGISGDTDLMDGSQFCLWEIA
jgi:hypothetical protein